MAVFCHYCRKRIARSRPIADERERSSAIRHLESCIEARGLAGVPGVRPASFLLMLLEQKQSYMDPAPGWTLPNPKRQAGSRAASAAVTSPNVARKRPGTGADVDSGDGQPFYESKYEAPLRRTSEGSPQAAAAKSPTRKRTGALKECPCGGGNENCDWCFGKGTYDPSAEPQTARPFGTEPPRRTPRSTPLRSVPSRGEHPDDSVTSASAAAGREGPARGASGASARAEQLARPARGTTKLAKSKRPLSRCRKCGGLVAEQNWVRHWGKVHRARPDPFQPHSAAPTRSATRTPATRSDSQRDTSVTPSLEQRRDERRLDGTRDGYKLGARELSGRFPSAVSFDPFDDDSDP